MIAAYICVSSRSPNFAAQKHAIATAATVRKDEIGAWFSEKNGAKKLDRTELLRVRELARAGELKKLYVYRLDRLASRIRDVLIVIVELRAAGCEVVTVADGFDLAGPAAEIIVAVMTWAGQMELLAIGERMALAQARIEREGGQWGRPRLLPLELERAILHRREKLRSSIREIAEALEIPKSTVADVLAGKGGYGREKKKTTKKNRRGP